MMHRILLALLFIFPGIAYAQEDPGSYEKAMQGCEGNQGEMNWCAYYKFKAADDELNQLYQQKLSFFLDPATKQRFIAAQRAWLNFRDADCFYVTGPRELSGSIWPMRHYLCREQHTLRRIEDMKLFLNCTQNGCPQ